MELDSKCPTGPIETRWDRHRFNLKLVNPANKGKHTILVVGTGLAGGTSGSVLQAPNPAQSERIVAASVPRVASCVRPGSA